MVTGLVGAVFADASSLCSVTDEALRWGEDVTISWDQVRAWRLQRQFLDPRGSADAVDVISRLCGVQAQVTSSAGLAVRLRQTTPKGRSRTASPTGPWSRPG